MYAVGMFPTLKSPWEEEEGKKKYPVRLLKISLVVPAWSGEPILLTFIHGYFDDRSC